MTNIKDNMGDEILCFVRKVKLKFNCIWFLDNNKMEVDIKIGMKFCDMAKVG